MSLVRSLRDYLNDQAYNLANPDLPRARRELE